VSIGAIQTVALQICQIVMLPTSVMSTTFTYQSILQDAYKVNWRVDDLIGTDKPLDFTKPFLPEALVGVEEIQCLSDRDKLTLNQIRGKSYLHLFILVEEFIIPMVLEQIRVKGFDDIAATQALLCFAEEEGKHIHLFQRFTEEFDRGFGSVCDCISPVAELANKILQHHPLSVLLLTLQFEWTTQSHYLESVRDNQSEDLDSRFCSLLKHHWLEEAQHTKLDELLVYELKARLREPEIEAAIADYLKIVHLLDRALMMQVQLDLENLERVIDQPLSGSQKQEIQTVQEQAYRWTFVCAGLTHPHFVRVLGELSPTGQETVIQLAKNLS